MDGGSAGRIPIQVSRNCVVASIQVDLDDEILRMFRDELLELLQTSGASGVILDVSSVEVLDVEEFAGLRRTMAMAALMGARAIIAGLRPGVVSALVDLGADTEGLEAALNLDDAFRLVEPTKMGMLEDAEPNGTDLEDAKPDEANTEGPNGSDTETDSSAGEIRL